LLPGPDLAGGKPGAQLTCEDTVGDCKSFRTGKCILTIDSVMIILLLEILKKLRLGDFLDNYQEREITK